VWTIPQAEINNFVDFANSSHTTIKFTCELSSEGVVFLDTKVYKGARFADSKILDVQTHYKPTETFQYTHFSSAHPFNVKKGFIKGETLRLLRTNSDRESFEARKRDFQSRLFERGYPKDLVTDILSSVQFSSRQSSLENKPRTSKSILPFVTTYNPATPNLKRILTKHWHLLSQTPNLARIYSDPPMVSYRKDKSLKDILVRAKLPST